MTIVRLAEYQNGNCATAIYSDGTKIRFEADDPQPEFPESIDMKITNCWYCHESSTYFGNHAEIDFIQNLLEDLPKGVELALGGGNIFEYPDLFKLLNLLKDKDFICNTTINAAHIDKKLINQMRKQNLIYGLGISYDCNYFEEIMNIKDNNTVIHYIAGINEPGDIYWINHKKILILGCKDYGRNKGFIPNFSNWKNEMKNLINNFHISFDNLALEQLGIKELIDDKIWEQNYMGDEGQFTMYIDAVNKKYAKNSTSIRKDINNMKLRELFNEVKND